MLFLGSSISVLWSFFFVQSTWEGQFYCLKFYYYVWDVLLYNMVVENTASVSAYFFFFPILPQADILEQLFLELENSIRTTGQYPGR